MLQQITPKLKILWNYIREAFPIIFVLFLCVYSVYSFPINFIVSVFSLVGVWLLDGFLKEKFSIDNETLFADLSFAAFIFSGSQVITEIGRYQSNDKYVDYLLKLCVLTFILFFIWILNLSLFREFNGPGAPEAVGGDRREPIKITIYHKEYLLSSLVFSILSTIIAVLPHIEGIL